MLIIARTACVQTVAMNGNSNTWVRWLCSVIIILRLLIGFIIFIYIQMWAYIAPWVTNFNRSRLFFKWFLTGMENAKRSKSDTGKRCTEKRENVHYGKLSALICTSVCIWK